MPHRTIRLQLGLICIALLASPHPRSLRAAPANESKNSAAKLSPAPDSKEVCPDTPLRIDFPTAPSIGVGKITVFDASNEAPIETIDVAVATRSKTIGGFPNFNYHPVLISGNQAAIYLPDHALGYNKTYFVKIDDGAFKDRDGNALIGPSDQNSGDFPRRQPRRPAAQRKLPLPPMAPAISPPCKGQSISCPMATASR